MRFRPSVKSIDRRHHALSEKANIIIGVGGLNHPDQARYRRSTSSCTGQITAASRSRQPSRSPPLSVCIGDRRAPQLGLSQDERQIVGKFVIVQIGHLV